MGIDQPQRSQQKDEVNAAIECKEKGAIYELIIIPISCEIVVNIRDRVDDQLYGDEGNHHDT